MMIDMKVTDEIHHIRCPYRRPGYFTGVIAILGDVITLIDTGVASSPKEAIFPYLQVAERRVDEIASIVLTHTHSDHLDGLPAILAESDAQIVVHELGKPRVLDLAARTPFDSSRVTTVTHGEVLQLSDHELEVFHAPGHSVDSICLIDRALGLCISGDSIQGLGENRPLLYYSSLAYTNSMQRLSRETLDILVMGHPFPRSEQGVVRGHAVPVIFQESLRAVDHLKDQVIHVLQAAGRPLSLHDLSQRLPDVREPSLEAVIHELSGEGRLRKIGTGPETLWLRWA
jgi:glyoxylase-like metal-dependent hydrolase (beta-lactamase superfamily II)